VVAPNFGREGVYGGAVVSHQSSPDVALNEGKAWEGKRLSHTTYDKVIHGLWRGTTEVNGGNHDDSRTTTSPGKSVR
jgi:hypothetical protein